MNEFENLSLIRPDFTLHQAASNLIFNEQVKELINSGKDVAHFAFGQSPFPIPDCLKESLKEFAHVHSYLPVQGIPELRQAVSDFHLRYDDIKLDPDCLIVAPGSKELIYLIMNLFNGIVLIPSPSWTTYDPQSYLASKQVLVINTDKSLGWKVTPECLEKVLVAFNNRNSKEFKLLILTNPGNPTGTCYSEEELINLRSCCQKNSILVLSDEIYSRLSFSKKHYSMVKYYPEGTIMANGFSKWASVGGWRLGYAYVPPRLKRLREAIITAASHTYSCAPAPMQYAFAKALTENASELDEYMVDCSTILNMIGAYCYKVLSSVGVTGHRSDAGYYFMADFEVIRVGLEKRGITTGKQLVDTLLAEADVALMESEKFMRPSSELSTRFCFVCFDGKKTLAAIKSCRGSEMELFQTKFVELHCKTLVEGIQRLKLFVESHL